MTKCYVFIATSLDGYIARPEGDIDWLTAANALVPPGEDCGFAHFMSGMDALVMGRNTFQQVLTLGDWPYAQTPVIVLSRQLTNLPAHLPATVSLTSQEPAQLLQRLSARGLQHIYVDGGLTIQGFLAGGLIDEITITLIPILLGAGLALFGPLSGDVHLELISSHAYDFGFVQNKYRLIRKTWRGS